MTAVGTWNLTMNTPMGVQTGAFTVVDDAGALSASMTGPDGSVEQVTDVKQDGEKLSWKVAVKKPIPLTLHFDVTIEGDALSGKFRPGMFPPSPVSGVRA